MDPERRLRQLTADFPDTPPPSPEALATVVRRGRRAALLHRTGVAGGIAAAAAAVSLVVPNLLERPTPPVIAPVVDEPQRDASPEPSPSASHDGGVDDAVVEALVIEDPSPSPEPSVEPTPSRTPSAEPAPKVVASTPDAPAPQPSTKPAPEPSPTATASPKPSPSPSPKPSPESSAPFEGFTVSVTTSKATYAEGASPVITIRACNTTERVREQKHDATGHRYDVWIQHVDSGTWVADTTHRAYAQAIEIVRWEPGQCREFTETWDATYGPIDGTAGEPAPGGTYKAKVKWMGREAGQALDYRYSPVFSLAGPSQPAAFEGFTVTLSTDKASYGYEEQVTFKVRACNTSGEAREQVLPHDGHWFDLYVKNASGQVVADTTWRSYSGPEKVVSIPAGACETFLETWWQCEGDVHSEPTGAHLPAGTYTAKIQWLGREQGQEFGWVNSPAFELRG